MALEKELEYYKAHKTELVANHLGQWVLINIEDDKVHLSTWCCYGDAVKLGYERFGLKPFLVKRILKDETHRFYLGMAGRVVDGVLQPDSVSLLDKPVDERCYVDLPHGF